MNPETISKLCRAVNAANKEYRAAMKKHGKKVTGDLFKLTPDKKRWTELCKVEAVATRAEIHDLLYMSLYSGSGEVN